MNIKLEQLADALLRFDPAACAVANSFADQTARAIVASLAEGVTAVAFSLREHATANAQAEANQGETK